MSRMIRTTSFVALALVVVAACATASGEADMQQMASAATKVARQLDAYVFGHPDAAALTSGDLAAEMRRQDAELMATLDDYQVRFRVVGENSSMLVCAKDGSRALLEDAGCSAISDLHQWDGPPAPCEFSLDLSVVCAAP